METYDNDVFEDNAEKQLAVTYPGGRGAFTQTRHLHIPLQGADSWEQS